ncbi:MAG: TIGR00725 family protein [Candidatus Thorarchaeota archaeon]
MRMRMISVIGGSETDAEVLKLAEEIGSEIARRGAALVCGGMGGVMEAACRGAKTHDGLTIGITPFDSKDVSNDFVDIVIPTGMGYGRNFLVAKSGDAVIAIAGAAGTLSEMAIAWFSDRPIVALENSGGWAAQMAGKRIDERRSDSVYTADNAKDAVDLAFKALGWT